MPAKVTYDLIEPNVAEVDVSGNTVSVSWKCPVSGKVVASSQATMSAPATAAKAASSAVKRTLLVEGLGWLVRLVGTTLGGTAGRAASGAAMAARPGLDRKITKPVYDTAAEHKAVVEAFKSVESKFRWDEDRELYVAA